MKEQKDLPPLPESKDNFWDGEKETVNLSRADRITVCEAHKKNWVEHIGYVDNKDGTVSCTKCPWGTRLPGYMRVLDEKIIDLRGINRG